MLFYKRLIRGLIYCLATSYSHRDKVPTTIGAKELNFRVRYGNGCDLFAIATKHLTFYQDIHYYNMNPNKMQEEIFIPSKLDNKKVFHFLKRG